MSAAAALVNDDYPLTDGGAVFAAAWAEGWDVSDPLPVDQWADKYRVLPRESASEHGPWRTDRTPYLREPMQVLSDSHPCKRVVLVFGTQTGKTECGNNWVGANIHESPSSMMVVQPTVEMGKRWTRQRLNPMIKLTPELQERIPPSRSRDSGNTSAMKEFPGGFLVVAGSNSAASLSSMPVRRLFLDEVDRYPADVEDEGHPVDVAERRTSSFPRRKILITSTPTVKDESVVWDEFEASDQRYYYVPCPHCGHMQVLRDENLADDATFLCEAGGHFIEEHHKTEMLARGVWIARNPGSIIPGFHLPSYYAALGLGYSWADIVELRQKAKDRPEKSKTYTNTIMAECYEDDSGKVDWKDISERAGGYSSRTIPDGCLMLTAGVDTQDDRWAVTIMGFGRRGRWFAVDWFEIPGKPGIEEEWAVLDSAVLDPTFVNGHGVTLRVLAMAVDTGGHNTHMAYQYCRLRQHRRVMAIKGSKFQGRPILPSRPSPQDVKTNGQILRAGVDLWLVGTDTAKGAIFAKLNADLGVEAEEIRFRHPSDLPDDYYQQLTAERYDTTKERWVKPRHTRNEALDCTVYALAAASHPAIRVDKLRDKDWEKIEAKVQPAIGDLFDQVASSDTPAAVPAEPEDSAPEAASPNPSPAPPPPPQQPKPKPSRRPRNPRKGGFVGGFTQ